MARVEPPQPRVIHVHGAELGKPRVGPTRALALMHLEQNLLYAPVDAGGDDALNLHALARNTVLVVSVSVMGG